MNEASRPSSVPPPFWQLPVGVAAGLLALLSASCCVLPLALAIVGLGGSWLAFLTPFVVYRGVILTLVGVAVVGLWVGTIRRPRCARRRVALGFSAFVTAVFVVAVAAPLWERPITQQLWSLWARLS